MYKKIMYFFTVAAVAPWMVDALQIYLFSNILIALYNFHCTDMSHVI